MSSVAPSMRQAWEPLRRAWTGSPLPGFFRWWAGQLRGLLPPRWQAALAQAEPWYLLSLQQGQWQLSRAGTAGTLARWSDQLEPAAQLQALQQALTTVAVEDRRLALCLGAEQALRRRLLLPAAARDNLWQVAGYEMDRQTPFRLEQVYYAVRPLAEPAPPGRLAVELVVVPRGQLDAPLARLREVGIAVDAVDLAVADGRLGVNLLPAGQVPLRRHPRRRLNLALAATAVLLLVLAMGEWRHNRELALQAMQQQVEQMHTGAREVAALRQQWQDNAGAAGFLNRRKAQAPSVLAVLRELTQRLPADTWLERFTIDASGRIGFQGQSPQAAKLVDALKGAQLITEANFQGSIQRDPSTDKERFYMAAQLPKPPAAVGKGPGR